MFTQDLEDKGLAAWLVNGDGTWIQTDPTWRRSYALVKAEIDDRFSALFLAHLGERNGEIETAYDGAGIGLARAGLIDAKGDPGHGPIVYDPSFELLRAAAGIRAGSIENPLAHTLVYRRAVTAAAAICLMHAERMLIERRELARREPSVRLDAGFADVRRSVYKGEQRAWHHPYLDLAGEVTTRELIAHIENPDGGQASPLRDIALRWAADERSLLAASVAAERALAEEAYYLELRKSAPSPGRRLFDAVDGALRAGAIKNEDSVLTVSLDLGHEGQGTVKVPARALISAALDDSLAMLPYQAVGERFSGGARLRGVKPRAVASVRYGRREIYAREVREAPQVATTAGLKAALAERDPSRSPERGASRTESIGRRGMR